MNKPTILKGLAGRSVVVTGGGSGIGRATVHLLAEAGCKVTIADISESAGQSVCAEIESLGGEAQAIRTDVGSENDVQALVQAALSCFGGLQGAVNAAAVQPAGKALHEISIDEWDRLHRINLRGLFLCNKYQVAAMLDGTGGSIVNISSTTGVVGIANGAEYCASKAGVLGLTRGAAIDYATKGIRVNSVMPGGTLTPMLKSAFEVDPTLEPGMAAVHPMNRFAQPEEIASLARFLLSDEASFITGATYAADGGHTCI